MLGLPMSMSIIEDILHKIVSKDMVIENNKRPHAVVRTCTDAIKTAAMEFIRYDRCDNECMPGYLSLDVEEAGEEPIPAPACTAMGRNKVKIKYRRDKFLNEYIPRLKDIIVNPVPRRCKKNNTSPKPSPKRESDII